MGTLKIYRRPENFRLPIRYSRIEMPQTEGRETNASFCRRVNSEIPDFEHYQLGVIFHIRLTIPFPTEDGLEEREISHPQFYNYDIYVPNNELGLLYCIGPNIQILHEFLLAHARLNSLFHTPFDLSILERAQRQGRIGVLGQTCILDQGTRKMSQRKTDGNPFSQTDVNFEHGTGVEQEAFELQVPYQNGHKSVYIYADGKITSKGRDVSRVESFKILRAAHTYLRGILGI